MSFLKAVGAASSRIIVPKFTVKESSRSCGKIRDDCRKAESCWNCKESVDCTKHFFCNKCDHIQPLEDQNLFEYLGMNPSYAVDENFLKKRFRDLQFKLHPDKFAQATELEKNLSDEHSRKLNRAFKTLSEPLARARYLLEVLGEKETKTDLSPDELMEMMEWNERVVEMTPDKLVEERKTVQKNILQCLSDLQQAFSQKNIDEVKHKITLLSYYYSLRKNIDDKLERNISN